MLYNLQEYHRPTDLDEAVRLLARKEVRTVPLAGGTHLLGSPERDLQAVIDLADLKLGFIEWDGETLHIGAMTRLQQIAEELSGVADGVLSAAARQTAPAHLRGQATLGGLLASADQHAPLSVVVAALKGRVKIYLQPGEIPYWSEMAKDVRIKGGLPGQIMTTVSLHVPESGLGAAYEQVGRTPADRPIVSAAAAAYLKEDEIFYYLAIGGLLRDLVVIGLPGPAADASKGVEAVLAKLGGLRAAEASYQGDPLGSAEYRKGVAPVLARRALEAAAQRLTS